MFSEQNPFLRRIYLLGGFLVHDEAGLRPIGGEKTQSLLAYLVLHPRASRREVIADLLWPDTAPERGRRNFSDTLYRLQKILGGRWLIAEGESVALRVDENLWADVWEFDRLATSKERIDLQKAADLYAGELLPELYDDWLIPEREFRRNQFLTLLEILGSRLEAEGDLQQALLITRRLILAEPLHEPAHQMYLRLLGRLQRYGEALSHYDYLHQLLESELSVEPLAETRQIMEALKRERALAATPLVSQERLVFVGRTEERATALAAVETALKGGGGILAIEGVAGIGKSLLLREIAAGARWRGATVLQGVASETPEVSPFSPLVDALAPFLNSPRGAQLETLLPPETLTALASFYPAWRGRATLFDVPPEQAGRQFNTALLALADALAHFPPLVIALDDMQWATTALWESLQVLSPKLTQNGTLLILLYRRPDIEHTIGWEKLQNWDRAGILTILSLSPFSVEEVAQLLQDQQQADPVVIHALTGGNPFLIREWLAQPVHPQTTGERLITHRFEKISPAMRSVLECAAVLGENIPYSLWASMVEVSPLALSALSDELTENHWLQPSTAGFVFAHDLIRTAIYGEIHPTRLRDLHTRAARIYQSLEPDNVRACAFHLDRAGLEAEAGSVYRLAGEQDQARFAFIEAQHAFERALELMPPTPTTERVKTALSLARVCETSGNRMVQNRALDEALTGAEQLGDDNLLLEGWLVMGHAASTTNQFQVADEKLSLALTLAKRLQDRTREANALTLLGLSATRQFHPEDAQEYYTQALSLARELVAPSLEGLALRGLGMAAVDLGAPQEAVKWLEKARLVHQQNRDHLGLISTQTYLITALFHLGAWDHLIATAEEVLAELEKMGNRHSLAYVRQLRGLALFSLGDTLTARTLLEQAEQDYEVVGDRQAAGLARNVLGLIAEDEGRYQEALTLYRTALARAQELKAINEITLAQNDLGALLLRLEQPREAIVYLEKAYASAEEHNFILTRAKSEALLGLANLAVGKRNRAELLAAQGWDRFQAGVPIGEQPQGWLWALYRLKAALGQTLHANEVLQAAYDELLRQAQAINNLDLRRSFFERVPINRKIIVAYHRFKDYPPSLSISLARRTAPLGRPLREDEFVLIRWTLNTPEDEAFFDKTARRQHRLKRLLQEAEAQDAAPTDEDLAEVLGVSRRTILRDMQTLAAEMPRLTTRKRKM